MIRTANITECGRYRYSLTRDWSESGPNLVSPTVVFVGLNPSIADAEIDDPTIRRCIGFAHLWGFTRLEMVNLFAYRATDPKDLKRAYSPEGLFNEIAVRNASERAAMTVAAWGNHGVFQGAAEKYMKLLKDPRHLGLTKSGQPKHPLYLSTSIKAIPYER